MLKLALFFRGEAAVYFSDVESLAPERLVKRDHKLIEMPLHTRCAFGV